MLLSLDQRGTQLVADAKPASATSSELAGNSGSMWRKWARSLSVPGRYFALAKADCRRD